MMVRINHGQHTTDGAADVVTKKRRGPRQGPVRRRWRRAGLLDDQKGAVVPELLAGGAPAGAGRRAPQVPA